MKKRINYTTGTKQIELSVTSAGEIFYNGAKLKLFHIGKNPYVYAQCNKILINVARAVLQAFKPNPDFLDLQADHIDCNPENNKLSNLRWVTRKENNSREHARKMRSKNAKHTHYKPGETVVQAVKGDEVITAPNANKLASLLGCSRAIIHRILNPDDYPKSVFGYFIKRVKTTDENDIDIDTIEGEKHED